MSFKEFSYAHSVPAKKKYDHNLTDALAFDEPPAQLEPTLAEERLQRFQMTRVPVKRRWQEDRSN